MLSHSIFIFDKDSCFIEYKSALKGNTNVALTQTRGSQNKLTQNTYQGV